jgi:hypothetical protein
MGTCCVDRRHCCPGDFTCDLVEKTCRFQNTSIPIARFEQVNQGLCESGKKSCKDGSCCGRDKTCCQMFDGLQGCAPFVDAICCSDGAHACPDGSTCSIKEGVCVDIMTGMLSALGELEVLNNSIMCKKIQSA